MIAPTTITPINILKRYARDLAEEVTNHPAGLDERLLIAANNNDKQELENVIGDAETVLMNLAYTNHYEEDHA